MAFWSSKRVGYGLPNLPVFCPVSFPPSYRGRGNRGKVRSFLFRDISGIAGKESTALLWNESGYRMSTDMFGFEPAPTPRTNDRQEAAALAEVLKALRNHPAVAWCERQNTGAATVGGRFVRFGWRGCSDILGMLKDGRLLAVECKAQKGRLRPEQAEFLSLVRKFGGVAFVAHDCLDVAIELAGR